MKFVIRTYENWEVSCTYEVSAPTSELALQSLKNLHPVIDELPDIQILEQTIYQTNLIEASNE